MMGRWFGSAAILLLSQSVAFAKEGAEHAELGDHLGLWTVAPFALLLLAIAILPLAAAHWWEHNKNKAIVSLALGIPVAALIIYMGEWHEVLDAVREYAAFIALLGALYIISGGIHVGGSLSGTPLLNTAILAIGAVIANILGTTGASMLLIRPLLRANEKRKSKVHIVVFFIFIVSNVGGCLTPLGDPPLFLGFLRGVPFEWTLRLWMEWLTAVIALLVVFNVWDQIVFRKEEMATPADLDDIVTTKTPVFIEGMVNFAFIGGVVLTVFLCGTFSQKSPAFEHWSKEIQVVAMAAMAGLSLAATPRAAREGNKFTYGPIIEVAVLFAGIFLTMVAPVAILKARGDELGLVAPWQFFWATGTLSSFLDNAPTYVTFASTACGLTHADPKNLKTLLETAMGPALLTAISCGAVFMGANTYIGNGPNFMVKAIADESGVKMPSFFGYMLYSIGILIPIFIVITFLFFSPFGAPATGH